MFREIWSALTDAPESAARVEITGPPDVLPSIFPLTQLATVAVVSSLAVAAGDADLTVDTRHVGAAYRSERYLLVDREPAGDPFDPLSRFFRDRGRMDSPPRQLPVAPRAAAGRVGGRGGSRRGGRRGRALARPGAGGRRRRRRAAARRSSARPAESRAHPQGKIVAGLPLLELAPVGPAPVRVDRVSRGCSTSRASSRVPCAPARSPRTAPTSSASTVPECRSRRCSRTTRSSGSAARTSTCATRPNAPSSRTSSPTRTSSCRGTGPVPSTGSASIRPSLVGRHPGLVVVCLSAWGHDGPWSGRRGFDSLVQAASGIAVLERTAGDDPPGALPAQILDHATGYLAAAAALVALRRQRLDGGSWHAAAVVGADRFVAPPPAAARDVGRRRARRPRRTSSTCPWVTTPSPSSRLPASVDGRGLRWPGPPPWLGADAPRW